MKRNVMVNAVLCVLSTLALILLEIYYTYSQAIYFDRRMDSIEHYMQSAGFKIDFEIFLYPLLLCVISCTVSNLIWKRYKRTTSAISKQVRIRATLLAVLALLAPILILPLLQISGALAYLHILYPSRASLALVGAVASGMLISYITP